MNPVSTQLCMKSMLLPNLYIHNLCKLLACTELSSSINISQTKKKCVISLTNGEKQKQHLKLFFYLIICLLYFNVFSFILSFRCLLFLFKYIHGLMKLYIIFVCYGSYFSHRLFWLTIWLSIKQKDQKKLKNTCQHNTSMAESLQSKLVAWPFFLSGAIGG